MKKGILLLLVLLSVFILGGSALSAVSLGEIQAGCCSQANEGYISFPRAFTSAPVVVVSAQRNGVPVAAGAWSMSETEFGLALYDLNGNPITNSSGVWVQWVAILPKPGVAIRAGCQRLSDGAYISYSNIGTTYPVAVCSSQENTVPQLAAAVNTGATGFTLSLKDIDGNPTTGWVQYIVINPFTAVNYYSEASILSGCALYNNGAPISFDLTRYPNGIVSSGQKNCVAHATCAIGNSQYGFNLGILDHAGNPGSQVWGSWLAVGVR
jgi:hypothetical protein